MNTNSRNFIAVSVLALLLLMYADFVSNTWIFDEDSHFDHSHAEDVHEHADLKVYLDGEFLDLNDDKYMGGSIFEEGLNQHFHDNDGEVIHKHAENVNLGMLFTSFGMQFMRECFVDDKTRKFCNTADKKLRMFVNGKENFEFDNYNISDLDKVLIVYGNYSNEKIQELISQISDKSCIQSGTCPEKGIPTDSAGGCTTLSGCSE